MAETRGVRDAAAICEAKKKDVDRRAAGRDGYVRVLVLVRHEYAHAGGALCRTVTDTTADMNARMKKTCIVVGVKENECRGEVR